jgi:hypothetical protein
MEQRPLGSEQFLSKRRNSLHFMEPEVSLPCSQQPGIGLFPSQVNHSTISRRTAWKVNFVFSSHPHPGLPSNLLPSGFQNKTTHTFFFSRRVQYVSKYLILLESSTFQKYMKCAWADNYEESNQLVAWAKFATHALLERMWQLKFESSQVTWLRFIC